MSRQRGRGEEDVPFSVEDTGGGRAQRLQHLLFEEVDRLFRLEVNDSRLQEVSIVGLQLSPDLRNAKVMYALRGRAVRREEQVQEGLQRVTPFLRARVAEALTIKRTPDLHFHRDRTAEASLRAAAVLEAEGRRAARKSAAAAQNGAVDAPDGPAVAQNGAADAPDGAAGAQSGAAGAQNEAADDQSVRP